MIQSGDEAILSSHLGHLLGISHVFLLVRTRDDTLGLCASVGAFRALLQGLNTPTPKQFAPHYRNVLSNLSTSKSMFDKGDRDLANSTD